MSQRKPIRNWRKDPHYSRIFPEEMNEFFRILSDSCGEIFEKGSTSISKYDYIEPAKPLSVFGDSRKHSIHSLCLHQNINRPEIEHPIYSFYNIIRTFHVTRYKVEVPWPKRQKLLEAPTIFESPNFDIMVIRIPTVEIGTVLDLSIPQGIQIILDKEKLKVKSFDAKLKGKKIKSNNEMKPYFESTLSNPQDSSFAGLFKALPSKSITTVRTLEKKWSFPEISKVVNLIPILGKTVLTLRFHPYAHDLVKLGKISTMEIDTHLRKMEVFNPENAIITKAVRTLELGIEIAKSYKTDTEISGANVKDCIGLAQYLMMSVAQAYYTPETHNLTLRHLDMRNPHVEELRKHLKKDIGGKQWGKLVKPNSWLK